MRRFDPAGATPLVRELMPGMFGWKPGSRVRVRLGDLAATGVVAGGRGGLVQVVLDGTGVEVSVPKVRVEGKEGGC